LFDLFRQSEKNGQPNYLALCGFLIVVFRSAKDRNKASFTERKATLVYRTMFTASHFKSMESSLRQVLSQYDLPSISQIQSLGSAGGFSGAHLWKVNTDASGFCLRRWPTPHPDADRLNWIHRVIRHAYHNDCPFLAVPRLTTGGDSFVRYQDSFWEVSHWMPGVANFLEDGNETRLKNMMRALARYHQTAAQVSLDFRPSSNLKSRIEQLQKLPRTVQQLVNVPLSFIGSPEVCDAVESLRRTILKNGESTGKRLLQSLRPLAGVVFPVQPILRDIWHDHVLFTGDEVTGVVDFGAMQMDNIAFDISRLLGSTIADSTTRWPLAVEIYSQTRPLMDSETVLIPLLDQTTTLLGSVNWLKWICLERRQFEDWSSVISRLAFLRGRLSHQL